MSIIRAVLYSRVSTDRQAQEGVSLETQLEMARKYCEAKDWMFTESYTDVMSGRNDKRPELKHLMDAANDHQFDVVIVYKIDRLARSVRKFHELLGTLQDNQINLLSLTQPFDTTTPMGKAMIALLAIFAELESDNTAERVRASLRHLAARGETFGGATPLGYDRKDKALTINLQEAETVREIFDSFLRIQSMRGTCDHLNISGYRSRKGKLFNVSSLKSILRNPIYFGQNAWNKSRFIRSPRGRRKIDNPSSQWITCDDVHPAIIDQETWGKAQDILQSNKGKHPRVIHGQKKSAWSGLLKCAGCGASMAKQNQPTYCCTQYCHGGKNSCQDYGYASIMWLTHRAIPKLSEILQEAVANANSYQPKPVTKRHTKSKEKQIEEMQARREREKELFRAGLSSFEEMKSQIEQIDKKIATLSETTIPQQKTIPSIPSNLVDIWGGLEEQYRGELLRLVIDHCEVSRSKFTFVFRQDWQGLPERVTIDKDSLRGRRLPK